MQNAHIAIINSGYSAITDCIHLAIPMIVLPIENHAEQFTNAMIIKMKNFGIKSNGNIDKDIEKIMDKYDFYKKNLEKNKESIEKIAYFSDKLII